MSMGAQRYPVRPGRSEMYSRQEVASGQSSPRTKKREGAEDPSKRVGRMGARRRGRKEDACSIAQDFRHDTAETGCTICRARRPGLREGGWEVRGGGWAWTLQEAAVAQRPRRRRLPVRRRTREAASCTLHIPVPVSAQGAGATAQCASRSAAAAAMATFDESMLEGREEHREGRAARTEASDGAGRGARARYRRTPDGHPPRETGQDDQGKPVRIHREGVWSPGLRRP
ncbi:hypothetical protein K466DRAFT_253404 [Polyporus arcularius HHB13444]|uniref:Uncharacterized protein n=1 Tax=Polyporus arcularius HHB13444 TaxID=1314778 RepID=A0A5C3P2H5_9APHY|nr:hypothetical protein K466DRAFT_253404 [Polyporus arcularius HHB13444]